MTTEDIVTEDDAPRRTPQEILELLGPILDEQKSLLEGERQSREFYAEKRKPYDDAVAALRFELREAMLESDAGFELGGGLKSILRRKVSFQITAPDAVRAWLVEQGRLDEVLVVDSKKVEALAKRFPVPGVVFVDQRELVVTEVKS